MREEKKPKSEMPEEKGLPPEVVEEILLYLPVKSLCRFRCISTTWQSLISERRFVRKHLRRLSQKTLILGNPEKSNDDKALCSVPLLSSLQNMMKEAPKVSLQLLPGPLTSSDGNRELLASCHGLLCISVDRLVYIWNPATKLYWKVPSAGGGAGTFDDDFVPSMYGLGYDSIRDDYKLVKLTRNWSERVTKAQVYSLRGGSWTELDNLLPPRYGPFTNAAFVSGSIHWLAFRNQSLPKRPYALLSFDLSSPDKIIKCREMPPIPDEISRCPIPPDYFVNSDLCVLDGMLCIMNESNSRFALWAMKDYSDEKSWTKFIDIEFGDEIFDSLGNRMEFKPLHRYEDGEVLMVVVTQGRTEIMICKEDAVLFREIIFKKPSLIRHGFVHGDSLISPLPDKVSTSRRYL